MSVRDLISVGLIVIVPVVAEAQPPTDAAAVPRTAWGAPDLEGVWDFNTRTPVERRFERAERDALPRWRQPDFPPPDGVGAYNGFWTDTPTARSERTSQIVDPPDGRIPPLMPGVPVQVGSVWADLAGRRPVRYRSGGIGADGPEDRGLAVRCLVGFNSGPPMVPIGYNNNMQLFQTSDYVVILTEMVHNARRGGRSARCAPSRSDVRLRRHPDRDGAQRADRPPRRALASARGPASVDGCRTWALGG